MSFFIRCALALTAAFTATQTLAGERYCYDRTRGDNQRVETTVYFISEEPYFEHRLTTITADGQRTVQENILLDRFHHCGVDTSNRGCRSFTYEINGRLSYEFSCGDQIKGSVKINRYGEGRFECLVQGAEPITLEFFGCYR